MLYRRLTWDRDRGFVWDCDPTQRPNAVKYVSATNDVCPNHYDINGSLEVRNIIEWVLSGSTALEPCDYYYLGNVIKYVLRCTRKNQFEQDLKKARHYINMMLGET